MAAIIGRAFTLLSAGGCCGALVASSTVFNRIAAAPDIARRRVFDNIFTERLWRTVKYEEVYLKDYTDPDDAWWGLDGYFRFYNRDRPHQALGYRTPAEVHFGASGDVRRKVGKVLVKA